MALNDQGIVKFGVKTVTNWKEKKHFVIAGYVENVLDARLGSRKVGLWKLVPISDVNRKKTKL